MKKSLFFLFFVLGYISNSFGQSFPLIVNNTSYGGSTTPLNIENAATSGSAITALAVNKRLVAFAVVPGVTVTGASGQSTNQWYIVDLPGTGSSAPPFGYVAAGSTFTNPVCSSNYVSITASSILIRPSAGSTSANVTISGANAKVFLGQNYAVTGSTTVGTVTWYQIDLPNFCSQTTGWISSFSGTSLLNYHSTGTDGLPAPSSLSSSSAGSSNELLTYPMAYYPTGTSFFFYNSGSFFASDVNSDLNTKDTLSLSPCTSYNITVRAVYFGIGCVSNPSGSSSFTTSCCTPPSTPTAFSASGIAPNSFNANWSGVSGLNYYIDVSLNSSFTSPIYTDQYAGTGTSSFNFSGLSCNTTYYYRVKASNGSCTSSPSSTISVTTGSCCTPPASPTVFSASGITSSSFNANWSGVGGLSYFIDVSTNSSFTSLVYNNQPVGTGTSFFNFTGISCNTTYYYRVRANNGSCTSASSTTISVTTGSCCTLPSVPAISAASSITPFAFVAHWNAASGATSYIIDVSTSPGFTSFVSSYHSFSVGNVTAYAITLGMSVNTTYYYRVSAHNGCGNSSTAGYTTVVTNQNQSSITNAIQSGINSCLVAEPINVATGSYEYSHTDLNIPAINTALNFTRYYNSVNNSRNSALGYGFSHTYDYYVTNLSDTLWTVHYADGHSCSFVPFTDGSGSSYPLFGGTYERLTKDAGSGIFSLTFKSGEVYAFNSSARLATITDRNGNVTTLNYSGGDLTSIAAPGDRTLTLGYTGSNITSITDGLGRAVHYGYDGSNNLITATDPNNHTTTFGYTGEHLMKWIVTANGDTLLSNTYDSQNRVTAQSDALHNITGISYSTTDTGKATITHPNGDSMVVYHDKFYRLVRQIDELGHSKTYTYDYNNNIDSFIDENGRILKFTYDTSGNLLSALKPTGLTTRLIYNSISRPVSIKDAVGNTDSMVYDDKGNVTKVYLPNGGQLDFFYNSNGLPDSAHDALGHSTYYNYNAFGDLISIISQAGTRAFGYDASGRLTSYTNENNVVAHIVYSGIDKIEKVVDAYGDTIRYMYDVDDNLVQLQNKKGIVTMLHYDAKSRLRTIQFANGGIEAIAYDSRDNIIADTNANGNVITYGYDAKKRLISVTNALGTVRYGYDAAQNKTSDTDASGNVRLYTYDGLNQMDTIIDELGNHSYLSYDSIGQIIGVRDPMSRTTRYHHNVAGIIDSVLDALHHTTSATYDLNGDLIALRDPKTHLQTFRYDALRRLTSVSNATGVVDSFLFDGVGNVVTQRNKLGVISKTYDSLNRVTHIANTGGNNYDYAYDKNNNLTSAHNNNGTTTFVFDSLDHIKRYIDVFGDTVSYTYDSAGNKKTMQYPGGHVVTYGYNSANLPASVTDWLGNVTKYSYDANGRLKLIINPHNDTCKYTYNNAGQLIGHMNVIGSQVISKSIYTVNANGEKVVDQVWGQTPKHLRNKSFAYTYSNVDVLLSDSVNSYIHDSSGNRKKDLFAEGSAIDSFSVDNFLLSRTDSTGTVTFQYDALGNRIVRVKGSAYRRFVHDLSGGLPQVLVEMDSMGTIKANYIYGIGLISRIDSAGNILYYHFNAQHNTIALTNDSGQITDRYTYEDFGAMLSHTGDTKQPYTFLGQYGVEQENSTLYYMRARYYDAANHRFLSKDPYQGTLNEPQTINRYIYALNNPLEYSDPTGLYAEKDNQSKTSVGQPGFGESLIPVWGSARAAVDDFQNGRWGWGIFNTAMAISDVFLVKSLVTAVGKVVVEIAIKDIATGGLVKESAKELPIQIHHFATNKNTLFTPQMELIAKQFGLSLDEAWNKALLPHLGRHPNAYHNFVLEGMQHAAAAAKGSQSDFLKLFNEFVVQPITQNPELLRKSGW